jgi:hypothetical protein
MKNVWYSLAMVLSLSLMPMPTALSETHHIEKKCVRGCSCWGFFAEFLWVLNHLQWCVETHQTPVVYWGKHFAYYSPKGYNGSFNGWEYYFEPVSKLRYRSSDKIYVQNFYTDHFSTIAWYSDYIKTLPLLPEAERTSIQALPLQGNLAGDNSYPSSGEHLYSKKFRSFVHDNLIVPFITIKPVIMKKIKSFYQHNMAGHRVVGIHLRGAFGANEVGVVPARAICEEAKKHMVGDDTIFFIATDQMPMIEEAKKLLPGKVVFYDSYRQECSTNPSHASQWPPSMGEDVLIEAMLLSRCDHFVHTISNVSTAVLYFNPQLPHTMLYCSGTAKGKAPKPSPAMRLND